MIIWKYRSPLAAFTAALGFASVTLIAGCGGSGDVGSSPNTTQSTGTFGSLQFTTTVPKVTALGDSMTIAYKIWNAGSTSVTVLIPSAFEDSKVTQGSTLIWQASKASGTLEGWGVAVLHPGDSRSGTVMWDEKDLNHVRVGPGTYTIKAWSPIGGVDGTPYTGDEAETNFSPTAVNVTVL